MTNKEIDELVGDICKGVDPVEFRLQDQLDLLENEYEHGLLHIAEEELLKEVGL